MLDLFRRCGRFVGAFADYAGGRGAIAGGLVVAGAALEGVGVVLLIPVLALVTRSDANGGVLAAWAERRLGEVAGPVPFHRLAALLAVFALLITMRAIVISARDRALARLQLGFVERLGLSLGRRLAASRWEAVARLRHASVNHLLGREIERCGGAAHFLLQVSMSTVMLAGAGAMMMALSPALAAASLALLASGALALGPLLIRARDLGAAAARADLALADITHRFLGGLKPALAQNLQRRFLSEFEAASGDLRRRRLGFADRQGALRGALGLVAAAMAGGVVLIGFGPLHVAPPMLIAVLLILSRMTGPAIQIQQAALQLVHALPAYEAIMAMERQLTPEPQSASPRPARTPTGPVVFDDVWRLHPGGRGVRGIDLTLEPGEILGVRGASGAGKTTFADLLVGLLPPDRGEVRIGGAPLAGPSLIGWRNVLAYVSQDPFLFHDTVRRNLDWARPGADETELWRALALAGAAEIVRAMPGRLDTVVGDRGALISGGERQRLALARALIRRPRLLVLDEATNAIDLEGEREILGRLRALRPRPTVVIIAHRPETLEVCDRTIELRDGALVAALTATAETPAAAARRARA